MHDEVVKALASPETKEIWTAQGSDTNTMSQAEFARFLNAEIKRWAQVTQVSGAKLD
jgi:tripartite-type tricarboxylate transporter receptor subunit TctC